MKWGGGGGRVGEREGLEREGGDVGNERDRGGGVGGGEGVRGWGVGGGGGSGGGVSEGRRGEE